MLIRPALPSDAPAAVELLYATMGAYADALLGLDDHARALEMLRRFYLQVDNRFSHTLTELAELDGQPAGLLLSFPGGELGRRMLPMGRNVLAWYGPRDTLRVVWRGLPEVFYKEAYADEYLVSHLAVAPEFRRQGVGRALMLRAEEHARALGLPKCSLTVELGNAPARTLYISLGYQVVQTAQSRSMEERQHTPGFERMVKVL